jgi:hypothetical protein
MAGLASERVERRLTAILAADVAGYSRLMGADEEGTLARLKAHRRELVDREISEHRGRIVKTTGDGMLVEFASVVDAVRCAVEFQREMAGASNSASGSISATSSSTRTIFSAMASMSRRGLKLWPSRAGSASTASWAIRCATSSPSRSRTWASNRSRTLRGRCGPTGCFPMVRRRSPPRLPPEDGSRAGQSPALSPPVSPWPPELLPSGTHPRFSGRRLPP